MSRGEKVMVGVGAALIVGMLLVAAFSLGVYVGEHGWTTQGVRLTGPGPQPGQGPPPGGPQLPPGPPDLVGQVRALEGEVLSLATRDGPRTVEVTEGTRIRTAEGEDVGTDRLQPGTLVAVFGHLGDGGQAVTADVIVLLPARR